MLKENNFYFKSWIFLVSSESFIKKRMSIALTSWAYICRKTFFLSYWILKKLEKWFAVQKKKKKKLFLHFLCDLLLEEKHIWMSSQSSGYIWHKKNVLCFCLLKHVVSDGWCDVFFGFCTKLAVILHRKCDVRRIWALTPRICSSQRVAWPCTAWQENRKFPDRHLTGTPPSWLVCLNFLLLALGWLWNSLQIRSSFHKIGNIL